MAKRKPAALRVALIGDIVESRTSRNRRALHSELTSVLEATNDAGPVEDPLTVTLGDEFQGVYATLGDALSASFRVRLALSMGVRFGVGRGEAITLDAERGIHDGSAYWQARDAIVAVETQAERAAYRAVRTRFASEDDDPSHVTAVNAALLALDQLVGGLSEVSARILLARMNGESQRTIAVAEGITPSAVSQRVIRDGVEVAMESMRMLGELA